VAALEESAPFETSNISRGGMPELNQPNSGRPMQHSVVSSASN
jgi:hypothetical protein